MKFYYTTTAGEDQIQSKPEISLGGYKSGSIIPNDSFNNVFSEISLFQLSRDVEVEYIGIILKNELADATSISLWFVYPDGSYSKYLVAAVTLVDDANSVKSMENIPSRYSKPLYATFYEADGEGNKVSLGDLTAGEMIGLWIQRQLVDDLATDVCEDDNLYETDPENSDLVIPVTPAKSDPISIHLSWT